MTYQVVWQRALYAIFGINIESVTIVVTAFLAGLGIGSLVGGGLSQSRRNLLTMFAAAELTVAVYGVMSLRLFRWIGSAGLGLSLAGNAVLTLAALLPPTLLMGMTLPLLVADGVKSTLSSGKTVGSLYFANTIGSAVAAFGAVLAVLPGLGEQGSVNLAAALNFAAGILILSLTLSRPRSI
jgi:spermidine synthase